MFTGCGTALVTPFRRDLSLDEATLRRWSGARSKPASTFWFLAGPPAKAPPWSAPNTCA